MSDDKLPIMFFVTREIDQLRIEGSGSSAIPQWVLTGDDLLQKANELDAAFDLVVTNFKRHEDRESFGSNTVWVRLPPQNQAAELSCSIIPCFYT